MEGKEKMPEYYALTLTFKYLQNKTPKGQFKETIVYLTKLLNRSTKYKLWPEWRRTSGDIHYHGVVEIKDDIKWFKETLPRLKLQGYLLIKKIDNLDKWLFYCQKDAIIASGILEINVPIVDMIKEDDKRYPTLWKKPTSLKGMSCIEIISSNVEVSETRVENSQEGSVENQE